MRIDVLSDLFYECVSVKASKHEFTSSPALSRKREHPNYKSLDSYFQVDGNQWDQKDIIRIYQRMISK